MAQLYHPNILSLMGVTTFPRISIVTEWMDNGSLGSYFSFFYYFRFDIFFIFYFQFYYFFSFYIFYLFSFIFSDVLLRKKGTTFDWKQKIRWCVEIAQGILYLHTIVTPPIIHRDLKAKNM